MNAPKPGDPGTTSVLILLTVPDHWPDLSEKDITRKLRRNAHLLIPFLAAEVRRWGNTQALDTEGLRTLIDEIEAKAAGGGS